MRLSLTYSDIAFVPTEMSTVGHRDSLPTSTMFMGKVLSIPLLSAPMKKVTGVKMARKLLTLGGLPVLMRTDDGQADLRQFQDSGEIPGAAVVSIGATGDYLQRAADFIKAGARLICIDTANGFHATVGHAVNQLRRSKVPIKIIAGNVGSVEGYAFLSKLGVDAVRVGIGSGSACSTSIATGVGIGQVTLLQDIANYRSMLNEPSAAVIADGGITEAGDFCKALALGADVVMVGRYLAGTDESPGELIQSDNGPMKEYAGEASRSVKGNNAKHVEGVSTLVPYTGPVADRIQELVDGLKSSMAYLNCHTLEAYRKLWLDDHRFVQLSSNARHERTPHVLG